MLPETSTRPACVVTRALRFCVYVFAVLAALSIVAMMLITCADVVLRLFGRSIPGALDLVKICSVLALAGALPYTTAVKGHVAIEYFFHKLNRHGRIVVDTLVRLLAIALFLILAWRNILYGQNLREYGQVTMTLQVPMFWIPWVIAPSCLLVAFVIFYNLTHPGREMIKP